MKNDCTFCRNLLCLSNTVREDEVDACWEEEEEAVDTAEHLQKCLLMDGEICRAICGILERNDWGHGAIASAGTSFLRNSRVPSRER